MAPRTDPALLSPEPTGADLLAQVDRHLVDPVPRELRRTLTRALFALVDRDGTDDPDAPDAPDEELAAAARDRVVRLNMGVARSIAATMRGRSVDEDDLQQVAYVGLIAAAARFDPAASDDFLTFAVPTIRGHLQRHFRDHGWVVRPPRAVQEVQTRVIAVRDGLVHDGRGPTAAEIADAADLDVEQVLEALAAEGCFRPTSLDRPVGEDGEIALGDLLPDHQSQDDADARAALGPVVRRLAPRDRRILGMRFFEDRTQQEIGDALGITQMQVSRLLTRILRDLRRDLGPVTDAPDRTPLPSAA